jgi:cytochrome c biogenesis protein CcdA
VIPATAYAFTLGLVGLLNPCGFPLLPAYLSLFAGDTTGNVTVRIARGLRAGGCLTVGFLLVFGAFGTVASAALTFAAAAAPWLMSAVGLTLLALGLAGVFGRASGVRLFGFRFAPGNGALAMIGFGAAYAIGSLSCSLPLFLAGVSGAFADPAAFDDMTVFLAYAAGMGLFATGAAITAALAGAGSVRALRGAARAVPRLAGAVCVGAGVYLCVYWLRELLAPAARIPLIVDAQAVQSAVAGVLSQAALPVAVACGLLVAAGFVVLALAAQKEAHR